MELSNLPKTTKKSLRRVGRGGGSGRGKTAGRGTKGQKARGKPGLLFEGLKMKKSFIKRLPLTRGKGRLKRKSNPIIVKIKYLNMLPASSKVDIQALVKAGIVREKDAKAYGVKILGDGEVNKKLTVEVPISNSAADKVVKAGGKVISESTKSEVRRRTKKQKNRGTIN